MAAVQIQLFQSGTSVGAAGQAREDYVVGSPVQAIAVGGPYLAYKWSFGSKPIDIVDAVEANSVFDSSGSDTSLIEPIDVPGTYLIQLAVDSGSGLGATVDDVASITFYAGNPADQLQGVLAADPTQLPRRIPAFGETLQHNVADAIQPSGNTQGWSREWYRWFSVIGAIAQRRVATAISAAALRTVPSRISVDGSLGNILAGFLYEFSSSSSAADDGQYVIKPADRSGAGRWLAKPAAYYEFATPAALGAFNATNVPNGVNASVGVVNDEYQLVLAPAAAVLAAADGVNIIAAAAPTGAVWVRLYTVNLQAGFVTDWYLDAVAGLDTNTGLVGFPLKTFAELKNRLRGVVIQQSVNVHCAAGAYDMIDFRGLRAARVDGLIVYIIGTLASSAAQTIATITPTNSATRVRGAITATGFTFTDKTRLRITSGTQTGACAEVTAVTGAGACETSEWGQISNITFGTVVTPVVPAASSQFVVDTLLSTCQGFQLDMLGAERTRIVLQDFGSASTSPGVVGWSLGGNQNPNLGVGALVYRCNFNDTAGTTISGIGMLAVCSGSSGVVLLNALINLAGCVFRSGLVVTYNTVVNQRGTLCFDGSVLSVTNGGSLIANGNDIQFCDGGAVTALSVGACSSLVVTSCTLWSQDSSFTVGCSVQSPGGSLGYTTLPNIQATTQVKVGGTTALYTGLPLTVNGATMAPIA